MKNLILIGMPGTGKSTVGVILAKRLGYDFVDTDILISRTAGRTLPDILSNEGIDRFLELEGRVGTELRRETSVIATGGSMIFSDSAMENLKKDGLTVWLETPVEVIEKRLEDTRVSRGVAAPGHMTVRQIYAQREPVYRRYADIRIPCSEGTDNVVNAVLDAVAGKL